MEVFIVPFHNSRDGPSPPAFSKEVRETMMDVRDRSSGGLGFWLAQLESRVRSDLVEIDEEKWGTLRARLATELTGLENKVQPQVVGEAFEYLLQVVRYWFRKAAGNAEVDILAKLSDWGDRVAASLPPETMRTDPDSPEKGVPLTDLLGREIRDTILGVKSDQWQAKPTRGLRPSSKGR